MISALMSPRRVLPFLLLLTALAGWSASAHAQGIAIPPGGDLFTLGEGSGQVVDPVPTQHNAEPPTEATPVAACGAGSHPQPAADGRVPAGSATDGLSCNVDVLGHQGNSGGFKVYRYVDDAGRVCAYYDTALLFPINAFKFDASSLGVAVLDMSDPSHPVQTDT